MTILEQLNNKINFSPAEKTIADYILENKQDVLTMSIHKLAEENFTSTSVINRLCSKLNLNGFKEFKITLATELQKTPNEKTPFMDYNFPIGAYDSFYEFSKKLYQISLDSLNDTYNKLSAVDFKRATEILDKSRNIAIFAQGESFNRAQLFCNRMMKINIHILYPVLPFEDGNLAASLAKEDTAIVVSYSGNTKTLMDIVKIIKQQGSKIIGITSNPQSKLAKVSDAILLITDIESPNIKYGTFSSSIGLEFALNCIFSYFFIKDFHNNSSNRISYEKEYGHSQDLDEKNS